MELLSLPGGHVLSTAVTPGGHIKASHSSGNKTSNKSKN